MAAHEKTDVTKKDLIDLKQVMEAYAPRCAEMAEKLGETSIELNGIVTIHKGFFTLHNLIAKMLGRLAVMEPRDVDVSKWDHRKKNTAAETVKEIDKARKSIRSKKSPKAQR